MFVIDKRGPAVMLHGAWPPLPIDEWWHGPGARVSDRDALVKKWTRGLHRALQELAHGGSPHAIDTHAIGTPMESTPKHRSQSGKAKQFPQPMFGVKEELRDDTAKASGATKASSAMEASGATEASAATEASGAIEASGAMETSASTSTTVQASAPAEEVMSPCSPCSQRRSMPVL